MTSTAEDLAFALAALDAGCTTGQDSIGIYYAMYLKPENAEFWLMSKIAFGDTPILALAAAGRALKLQPKWVVVDLATANVANLVINREIDGLSIRICNAIDEGTLEDEAVLRGTRDALKRASKALANTLSSAPLKDGDKT